MYYFSLSVMKLLESFEHVDGMNVCYLKWSLCLVRTVLYWIKEVEGLLVSVALPSFDESGLE